MSPTDRSQRRAARAPARSRISGLTALTVAAVVLAVFATSPASAATDLSPGDAAVIARANGDRVRLRDAPGLDGDIIARLPEGTSLDILDGPLEGDDGSFWYEVAGGGESGYMIADYLFSPSDVGGTRTTDSVNLRSGPSTSERVRLVIPAGAFVEITGGPRRGFYQVIYSGRPGWAHGDYLDLGDDGGGDDGGSGTATVIDGALNLRAGPSTADGVILVLPDGAEVALTGDADNGFLSVSYRSTRGWAYAVYLDTGDGGGGQVIDEATVASPLNLRAAASTSAAILDVMPGGALVAITGEAESGFYPVIYDGQRGWAHGDYLDFGGAASIESAIIWPVAGGEWTISQGYNGSSHYNASSVYQYQHAFDIVRTDGATAGQAVYSPVNGTVRWTERGSGGIAIDLGNGYAVAIFHITVDRSLVAGTPLAQGQYIGFISGPGQEGNMGFDHLHFTVWATNDGGNWSRVSVPFSGDTAIAGVNYPDTGAGSAWYGTVFYP